MPKISVNEKDLSWYVRQRDPSDLVVYVPGIATFGPNEPVLVDNTTFANVFGKSVGISEDKSYDIAASLCTAGCNVLFHRIPLTGAAKASAQIAATDSNKLEIVAKYEGSFGNSLKVKCRGGENGPVYLFVYDANDVVLENLTYDFINPSSENWYEFTNASSKYVEVKLTGTYDATWTAPSETITLGQGEGSVEGKDFSGSAADVVAEVVATLKTADFLDDLKDPYQYTFNVVCDGGYNEYQHDEEGTVNSTLTDVDKALLGLATTRGTAVYLVAGHSEWDADSYYAYCGLFNSSYAAAFGPWHYAQLLSNGTMGLLPGSYVMLVRWAQSVSDGNPLWLAPAGVKRAQLGSFVKSAKYQVGKTILDSWQNQDTITPGQYKVNPIMKLKSYGYCVYGNSTLLHSGADGSTSMLQSFSVRVLANAIKSHAFDVSLSLQFDQITDDLFAQFKSLMGVYLDQLKYQGALYDYNLIVDRSAMTDVDLNNKNVPVRIQISPNPAAENFTINLEISQAGVSFNDDTDETEVG